MSRSVVIEQNSRAGAGRRRSRGAVVLIGAIALAAIAVVSPELSARQTVGLSCIVNRVPDDTCDLSRAGAVTRDCRIPGDGHLSWDCPWQQVSSAECSMIDFANLGLSSANFYQASCVWRIIECGSQPGECRPTNPAVNSTFTYICDRATGSACPGGGGGGGGRMDPLPEQP